MPSPTPLAIGDDMTIYLAAEQKARLLVALAAADSLDLDLARVGAIDSAGLQLLLLVKREAAATGKTLRIVAHSPAVRETIEFANLAARFGDPLVISAH